MDDRGGQEKCDGLGLEDLRGMSWRGVHLCPMPLYPLEWKGYWILPFVLPLNHTALHSHARIIQASNFASDPHPEPLKLNAKLPVVKDHQHQRNGSTSYSCVTPNLRICDDHARCEPVILPDRVRRTKRDVALTALAGWSRPGIRRSRNNRAGNLR